MNDGLVLVFTQVCVHPALEIWHHELKPFYNEKESVPCMKETNWVHVTNGTFFIAEQAIRDHGHITCRYTPVKRGSDDFTIHDMATVDIKHGAQISSDFFTVSCKSQGGKRYKNIHAAIVHKGDVKSLPPRFTPALPAGAMGLNVLVLGIDSLSRMAWLRNFPDTHNYFEKEMGGVILKGYNIVGDATPAALLPILCGKPETELPEARRGYPNAGPVDDHPWIWKQFRERGYVTQFSEDRQDINAFTYRMLGFKQQPVDHYMRPFHLKYDSLPIKNTSCVGSVSLYENSLNWVHEFFDVYKNDPKFSFTFLSGLTHDDINVARSVDLNMVKFLQALDTSGHLNDTLLLLMSDHGSRFQKIRQTLQGKYEERLPYVGFRFPPGFKHKFPKALTNFHKNVDRLTTPFDIHETLLDVLNFKRSAQEDISQRGLSLFAEIPLERTCPQAGIETHWCACLNWKPISIEDSMVVKGATQLLKKINSLTSYVRDDCSFLTLHKITRASLFMPNDDLLRYKKSIGSDERYPDLSDDMTPWEVFYELTLIAKPGFGLFEATIKYNTKHDVFNINETQISRINPYGRQPRCIETTMPRLLPFCYCKT